MAKVTNGKTTIEDYLRCAYPAIAVETNEERRLLSEVRSLTKREGLEDLKILTISASKKLADITDIDPKKHATIDPQSDFGKAFAYVGSKKEQLIVLVVFDFQHIIKNAGAYRALKDQFTDLKKAGSMVLLSAPVWDLPPELEHDMPRMDFALPTREQLKHAIEVAADSAKLKIDDATMTASVDAASGLTLQEAESAAALSVSKTRRINADLITYEKMRLIKSSGLLELAPVPHVTPGGLGSLMRYVDEEILAVKDDPLLRNRGQLLVGIQGGGKSLISLAIGAKLKWPVLKMSLAGMKAGIVGQSEGNMRKALKLAEAVAPCVLRVDEVDKGAGGHASSARSDGGTTLGMLEHWLTWLQEHQSPILTIATCLAGDSTVQTKSGLMVELDKMPSAGEVWGNPGWHGAKRLNQGIKETVVVKTGDGIIRCTPDHRFFVAGPRGLIEKQAGDLTAGDLIASAPLLPPGDDFRELKAVATNGRGKHAAQPAHMTDDLAYLVGYLCGDGSVHSKTGKHWQRLTWSEQDENLCNAVSSVVDSTFTVKPTVFKRKDADCFVGYADSVELGEFMRENFHDAVVRGSEKRAVPESIQRSGNSGVAAFIAGLIDSDGHVSKKTDQVCIGIVSGRLAKQTGLLLRRLGIFSTAGTYRPRTAVRQLVHRLSISDQESLRILLAKVPLRSQKKLAALKASVDRQSHHRIGRSDCRDVPHFAELVDELLKSQSIPQTVLPNFTGAKFRNGMSVTSGVAKLWLVVMEHFGLGIDKLKSLWSMKWTPVHNVQGGVCLPVFDLAIDHESHRFYADGFLVHNCNDYSKLPAELTRAGRFDERWFVDLPIALEREEIAAVHLPIFLKSVNNVSALAAHIVPLTDEWTGAEIEQLIKSAARLTKREITKTSLEVAAEKIKPLSKVKAEEIKTLRDWAKTSLRLANSVVDESDRAERRIRA